MGKIVYRKFVLLIVVIALAAGSNGATDSDKKEFVVLICALPPLIFCEKDAPKEFLHRCIESDDRQHLFQIEPTINQTPHKL